MWLCVGMNLHILKYVEGESKTTHYPVKTISWRLSWFSSTHQKIFCPHLKAGLTNLTLSEVIPQRRIPHSWSQSHIIGVERHLEHLIPVILPVSFTETRKAIYILSKSYLEVPGIIITYATQPFCKGQKYKAYLSSPHSQITRYSM